MRLYKLNSAAANSSLGTVLTIGNFDGVHLGHQALVKHAQAIAHTRQLPLMVMIFEPQAKEYFKPDNCPARLYKLREKICVLKTLGVDYVACVRFDSMLANTLPQDFFQHVILKECDARYLIIGPDFYFGKSRKGSPQSMQKLATNHGLPLEIYPVFSIGEQRVSSTWVREALAKNDFPLVHSLLGRNYFMIGKVGYGRQLGHKIGVPTANVMISRNKTALHGVFCVKITVCRTQSIWLGVANLGKRPTVDGQKWVLEVHLFDFQGLLYGDFIQVEFLHKIREEQTFSSVQTLKQQIDLDIKCAKEFFMH
jgi:riboflavin kinase/FMN adenylyltransferase